MGLKVCVCVGGGGGGGGGGAQAYNCPHPSYASDNTKTEHISY